MRQSFVISVLLSACTLPAFASAPGEHATATRPDKPRKAVSVVCRFQQHINSDPRKLYAALEKALGANAIEPRVHHDPYWIGGAKFPGGRMQVYEEDGVIDQINLWFDPPVHRDDALAMFGFPTTIRPTKEGPLFFIWKKVLDVDRLHFSRVRGANEIKSAMVEFRYQKGSTF